MCVCLPCSEEKDNYHTFVETIEHLQEIITKFHTTHNILIGGDFNENATRGTQSKRSISLHKFLQENSFVTRQTELTFIHPNGKDVSTIDFFLYKSFMEEKVLDINRKTEYLGNVSDHYPVSIVY